MTPGRDPGHLAVARAWPKRTLAARARAAGLHSVDAYLGAVADGSNHPRRAELTARAVRFARGASVPRPLLANLRRALDAVRWPPVSHRPKVDSERYLVLRREVLGANDPRSDVVDPYAELKNAAGAVLRWADPPDSGTTTSPSPETSSGRRTWTGRIRAISTRSRWGTTAEAASCASSPRMARRGGWWTLAPIARVDGRCAHWVRGWRDFGTNRPRYSVIYYVTRPQYATTVSFAVDEGWSPGDGCESGAGSAAPSRGW